ncbi:MAG: diacylglycerol/lipid kinase family protein [Candidatus Saccharimonadaceae bacterium]
MLKKKVCVIINPVSGTGSKQAIPEKIAAAFDPKKYDVLIRFTGYAGHATEITKKAVRENFKYVIAAGGDGTVNEIARAMVGTKCILGIIPMGSGNGLARDLNISMNLDKSIETISNGVVRIIDYGVANDNIFFCTCGVGFDAFVSEKFADEKMRGPIGYMKNILESVIDFKSEEYELTYDGETIKERAFVVTCANASQYGNEAYIAPNADMEDGKMNISLIKPINALEMPQTTIQLFTKSLHKNSKVINILTSDLLIKRNRSGVMHVDGESIDAGKEINVKIIPKGLHVLAPKKTKGSKRPAENDPLLSVFTRWFTY